MILQEGLAEAAKLLEQAGHMDQRLLSTVAFTAPPLPPPPPSVPVPIGVSQLMPPVHVEREKPFDDHYKCSFREMLWRRAGRHINSSTCATPVHQQISRDAFLHGIKVLQKEFRELAFQDDWAGLVASSSEGKE